MPAPRKIRIDFRISGCGRPEFNTLIDSVYIDQCDDVTYPDLSGIDIPYDFDHWSTARTMYDLDGNAYTELPTRFSCNTTIFAVYTPKTFTATFLDYDNVAHEMQFNSDETVEAPTYTHEGYTMTGYSPEVPTYLSEDAKFTSQWTINYYTVTWKCNNITIFSKKIAYNTTISTKLDNSTLISQCYTIASSINSDFFNTWTCGDTATITGDTVITAALYPYKFDCAFYMPTISGGTYLGTVYGLSVGDTVTPNDTWITLMKNQCSNIDFSGGVTWNKRTDNIGYDLAEWDPTEIGGAYGIDYTCTNSVKTFTVRWIYTDEDDVTQIIQTSTFTYGQPILADAFPSLPTVTGRTYTGWTTAAGTTVTRDIDISAIYSSNTYVVSFTYWNGTAITTTSAEYTYGAALTAPTADRTGYTYTWNTTIPETVITNASYVAQYTINQYTLVFTHKVITGRALGTGDALTLTYGTTAAKATYQKPYNFITTTPSTTYASAYADYQNCTVSSVTPSPSGVYVTADTTYLISYTPKYVNMTVKNAEGTILKTFKVYDGFTYLAELVHNFPTYTSYDLSAYNLNTVVNTSNGNIILQASAPGYVEQQNVLKFNPFGDEDEYLYIDCGTEQATTGSTASGANIASTIQGAMTVTYPTKTVGSSDFDYVCTGVLNSAYEYSNNVITESGWDSEEDSEDLNFGTSDSLLSSWTVLYTTPWTTKTKYATEVSAVNSAVVSTRYIQTRWVFYRTSGDSSEKVRILLQGTWTGSTDSTCYGFNSSLLLPPIPMSGCTLSLDYSSSNALTQNKEYKITTGNKQLFLPAGYNYFYVTIGVFNQSSSSIDLITAIQNRYATIAGNEDTYTASADLVKVVLANPINQNGTVLSVIS